MQRRGFLSFLGAAIAGATLDPERLLWVPGKKIISIPKPIIPEPLYIGPVSISNGSVTITYWHHQPPIYQI